MPGLCSAITDGRSFRVANWNTSKSRMARLGLVKALFESAQHVGSRFRAPHCLLPPRQIKTLPEGTADVPSICHDAS